MKPKGLTARQQQFCVAWLVYNDATKAYREVFKPKNCKQRSINVNASKMLAKPAVHEEIKRLQAERDKPFILSANEVLEELTKLAKNALIGSDRVRCLDLLGKYHKLFSDGGNTLIGEQKVLVLYADPASGNTLPQSPLRVASPQESKKGKD